LIEYELDEVAMVAALYPYFKDLLDEEYELVPKDTQLINHVL